MGDATSFDPATDNRAPFDEFDFHRFRLRRGSSIAERERALEQANGRWAWLDRQHDDLTVSRQLRRDRRFERLEQRTIELLETIERELSTPPDAGTRKQLDRRLRDLIALEDRIERGLGELLAYVRDRRGWQSIGFGGVGHYGSERLGLGRRTAQLRSHAAGLERQCPQLWRAYMTGRIGLDSLLLVAKALGPKRPAPWIERLWVAHAAETSVKRLRDELRLLRREAWTEDWMAAPPLPPDDERWHRSLALHPGTVRRRLARLAGRALSHASGRESNSAFVEWKVRLDEPLAMDFLAAVEGCRTALERAAAGAQMFSVADRDGGAIGAAKGERKGPRSALAALRMAARGVKLSTPAFVRAQDLLPALAAAVPASARAALAYVECGQRVPAWVGLMALVENYVNTWDPLGARGLGPHGAIHGRDGFRCAAPLCTSRAQLHVHHVHFRSRGGDDRPGNLTLPCAFHHLRGVHGLVASCTGEAPLGVRWRLGREDVAEWWMNERRIATVLAREL
jgi:hypothetical protein